VQKSGPKYKSRNFAPGDPAFDLARRRTSWVNQWPSRGHSRHWPTQCAGPKRCILDPQLYRGTYRKPMGGNSLAESKVGQSAKKWTKVQIAAFCYRGLVIRPGPRHADCWHTGTVRFARRASGPPRKALGRNTLALLLHQGPRASLWPKDRRCALLVRRPSSQSARVQYPRIADPPGARD
jgi:hypothetical protein